VFSTSGGPQGGGSTIAEDELDLQTLITVGETEDLSAQDVVDEIHSARGGGGRGIR